MNFKKLLQMKIANILIYLEWIEIRPRRTFTALVLFMSYLKEFKKFSSLTDWQVLKYPCIFDRKEMSGYFGEYFFQDLYVAKRIIELDPKRHIDVGSRVDGFIAHLACVRKVEVLDIRPVTATVDGICFHQIDISKISEDWHGVADCVSCLHTLEHFGLGRYGDKINPDGWKDGLNALHRILKMGGIFWLSVPIGMERVEFNAHRIFAPQTISNFAENIGLNLVEFAFLDYDKIIISSDINSDFSRLANVKYSLGIYKFIKG